MNLSQDFLTAKIIGHQDLEEILRIHRFRFEIYEAKGWLVGISPELRDLRLDRDKYDHHVDCFAVIYADGQMVATQRLIRYPDPFMVEGEYDGGMCAGLEMEFGEHVGEVSRLAVHPDWERKVLSGFPMCTVHHHLFRVIYRHCREAGISRLYTATLLEKTNAFRSLGFPLHRKRLRRLGNQDVIELVSLDWDQFEQQALERNPAMYQWYTG